MRVLSDPSLLSVSILASLTIHLSVMSSATSPPSKAPPRAATARPAPSDCARVPPCVVALIPCMAAAMLVTMFSFMQTIGPALLVLAAVVALPAVARLAGFLMRAGEEGPRAWAARAVSVVVTAAWMVSGHWMLNDVVGVSFCVMVASFVRIPSLKMLTILMLGLLVYDVLFVFVSPLLFGGRNVMVDVATALPRNPLDVALGGLGFPGLAVANLAFPGKFLIPVDWGKSAEFVILGLGDVVVPTCLFSFLRRVDLREETGWSWYYPVGLPAYVFALLFSFYINLSTGLAQPALLYIVPVLLAVTYGLACKRGEFGELWKGSPGNRGDIVLFEEEKWDDEQLPFLAHEPRLEAGSASRSID